MVISNGGEHLSRNNIDTSRLNTVIANWQTLPITEQPNFVKTFNEGLNHQTHLISSGRKQYVLKLFSEPNHLAIQSQKIAANHQLAPEILYVNQTNDFVLMEYINQQTIKHPLDNIELIALGNALKDLHLLPKNSADHTLKKFNLLKYYDLYLARINSNYSQIKSTHNELLPIIGVFLNDDTDWQVCHNDLVKENCFITPNGIKILDWEYTQINNPWFDLVTLIYSLKLDQKQTTKFIQAYDQQWQNIINTHFYFSALISMLWCDILWHLAEGRSFKSIHLKGKLSDLQNLQDQFNSLSL